MGIFSFFSKEKKETLDKGLSKTKENVFSKITRAIAGKSKVDDEVLDNLEEVLITSDVGVDTTLKIISRIEDRVARDKYVTTSELTAILREEIASLLTENHTEDLESFTVPEDKKPYVLTALGQQFVHYAMTDAVRRIEDGGAKEAQPSPEGKTQTYTDADLGTPH